VTLLVSVDDHAILGQLFLDKDHLLGSLDYKVPARIQRTLIGLGQLGCGLACQLTLGTSQHHWHSVHTHSQQAAKVTNDGCGTNDNCEQEKKYCKCLVQKAT